MPPTGGHASPGVCTRASRRGGSTRRSAPEKGWGGAARYSLGLDTSRRTGYGRTAVQGTAVQGLQSLTLEEKSNMLWENLE